MFTAPTERLASLTSRPWQPDLSLALLLHLPLNPLVVSPVPALNRLWEAFRTRRYLAVIHSELGHTPTQAIAKVVPQPLEPTVARELFLVRAVREVHKKDGCVSVDGQRFLCDASLRGRKVTVRDDPLSDARATGPAAPRSGRRSRAAMVKRAPSRSGPSALASRPAARRLRPGWRPCW